MNEKVAKRRDALINLAYAAVIFGLLFLFFRYCFWVAAPFLLTFLFAVINQRPLRWLDKKTHHKCHGLWSVLLVLLTILIILVPVGLLIQKLFQEIGSFISYLGDQMNDLPGFLTTLQKNVLHFLQFLPDGIYASVSTSVTGFFNNLIQDFDLSKIGLDLETVKSGISNGVSGVVNVVKSLPSALLAVVIGIIAWILFTKDYDKVVHFIKLQLPAKHKNLLSETKQLFSKTIVKMLRAYALIMFITFCELFLGFTVMNTIGIMHNAYAVVIAIGIAIFDILPVAGSGGILIPWALISLLVGNTKQGIGLLVLYVVITVIRQYIEPKIVGQTLGVNPLVTLMGLYFGLKIFGFIGMFLVPLAVMTVKAFNDTGRIHLYNPPARERAAAEATLRAADQPKKPLPNPFKKKK